MMFGKTIASVGALVALVSAQVAPGFPMTASQSLTLVFAGNNTVSPPGELIPRGETVRPPTISSPVWPSGLTGVLLMVDLDVPRNGTRVQLIHWIASGVTLGSGNASGSTPLNVPTGEVPYQQPSPPVGDTPHTYTFIVFAQPANFAIPSQYANLSMNRVGFNVAQFVSDARLAQPLAANYIRVQNLTGAPTTTFPPARPTNSTAPASSAPAVFPGGAAQMVLGGGGAAWAALMTAVLAGVAAFAL